MKNAESADKYLIFHIPETRRHICYANTFHFIKESTLMAKI